MLLPRHCFVALVASAALLGLHPHSADAATAKIDGWYPCPQYSLAEQLPTSNTTESGASVTPECAIFKAPLCHTGVCKDSKKMEVDIFVKRYMKGDGAGKPNVILMQGGPGAASPAMESGMTSLYKLLDADVNVFTMDHRGTGRSTLLDCVAAQAQTSGSPGGGGVSADEVPNCAQELENKYGDLASFSVTSAASDLKYFITNFLKGDTYVYGVSYGTLLVERLMHLEPEGVKGYVLDGIATTSGTANPTSKGMFMSKWDLNMDEVGKQFLSRCDENQEECGKYFAGSSLTSKLQSLMDSYDTGYSFQKCSSFLLDQLVTIFDIDSSTRTPGPYVRQIFSSLLKSLTMRKLIPVLTYRLDRCSLDDKLVLAHFFDMYNKASSLASEEDAMMSSLLYGLIVYSELWETPSPSLTTIQNRFIQALIASYGADVELYCAFTKDQDSYACSEFSSKTMYDAKPIAYKKDKYFNVAASPPKDVSVLLMSGKLDPQTPHKYAEYLLEALDTSNKELVAFDYATHATLWATPMANSNEPTCGMQILGSYVQNGGDLSKMDKSCLTKMPKFTFNLPKNSMYKWLNTTSAFDGEYVSGLAVYEDDETNSDGSTSSSSSSSGSSYQSVFIVAAVAFALMAVAATVFALLYRRTKKANNQAGDMEAATAHTKELSPVYTETTA